MFFISNTRKVFEIMITITQIDIALYSIVIEQLMSIITVNFLVNEKKFINNDYNLENINNKNSLV